MSALLLTIRSMRNMSVSQDCIEKRGEFVGSACGPKGPYVPDVLFWCVILFFSTVIMSAFLKEFKFSNYFPTKVRTVIHELVKKNDCKLKQHSGTAAAQRLAGNV